MVEFINLPAWLSLTLMVVVPTFVFYRLASWAQRRETRGQTWLSDATARVMNGYLVSVVGIILGFILVNAWNDSKRADDVVGQEAQTLTTLSRLIRQLPDQDQKRTRPLLIAYIDTVVQREWPAHIRGRAEASPETALDRLYAALSQINDLQGAQNQMYAQAPTLMTRVADLRQERSWLASGTMPDIIWFLMLFISLLTLGIISISASSDAHGHPVLVAAYTVTLCSILYVVAILQFPFAGPVHVKPTALLQARQIIQA